MDGVILKPFLHENIGCFQKFEALKPSISLKWLLPNLLDIWDAHTDDYLYREGKNAEVIIIFFFLRWETKLMGKYAYSYYDEVSTSEYLLAQYEIVAVLNTLRLMW